MADTVTGANLGVTHAGSAVPGTLTYDATSFKVKFAPQQKLDLLASYTVTAGAGFKDVAGNNLAAAQSWTFKTADGAWQGPSAFETSLATSIDPDIAIDADGNAVAVWSTQVGSGWYEVHSAARTAAGSWGSVTSVSTSGGYHALFPQVRFDAQGNGVAVWTQWDGVPGGTGAGVWAARYLQGQGWQAPVLVDDALPNNEQVSLAVDSAGNAFAVWAKQVGPGLTGNPDIWAARFTPAGGWGASARVGSSANIGTYDKADQPQVVVDAAGNAYVLWVQLTSAQPVWFAQYQVGSGWQPAVSVGAAQYGDPDSPRLAVSKAGQVMALWNTNIYAGGPYRLDVWYSFLSSPNGSWSTPALLETDDAGDAKWQKVVADPDGNFHAVWSQYASTYHSNVQYREYTPGAGWSATTTISDASGTYDQNRVPTLVADGDGNLMMVWGVYTSGTAGAEEGTFAKRYIAGEGWQPAVRIDHAGGTGALQAALAVSSNGSVAAAWIPPLPFTSWGPPTVNVLE